MYRYILLRTAREEMAKEFSTEVLLRLIDAIIARQVPRSGLRRWLFSTASQLINTYTYEDLYPGHISQQHVLTTINTLETWVDRLLAREMLWSVIPELNPMEQNVLALRFGAAFTPFETADLMGKDQLWALHASAIRTIMYCVGLDQFGQGESEKAYQQTLVTGLRYLEKGEMVDQIVSLSPWEEKRLRPALQAALVLATLLELRVPEGAVLRAHRAVSNQVERLRALAPEKRWSHTATAAVLAFLVGTGASIYVAHRALPGHPLYNLKLGMEQVALTLPTTNRDIMIDRLEKRRAEEVTELLGKGDLQVPITLEGIIEVVEEHHIFVNDVAIRVTPETTIVGDLIEGYRISLSGYSGEEEVVAEFVQTEPPELEIYLIQQAVEEPEEPAVIESEQQLLIPFAPGSQPAPPRPVAPPANVQASSEDPDNDDDDDDNGGSSGGGSNNGAPSQSGGGAPSTGGSTSGTGGGTTSGTGGTTSGSDDGGASDASNDDGGTNDDGNGNGNGNGGGND